jgi:hypothetical protein
MSFLRVAIRNLARPRLTLAVPGAKTHIPWSASYSVASGLSKDVIQTRVLDVLKGFEKVDPAKVSSTYSLVLFWKSSHNLFSSHPRPLLTMTLVLTAWTRWK